MDETELRNAMRVYGDTVYRLALCRMQNTADAEDVYQDVFLALLRQDRTDWEGECLKAWLIRTRLHRARTKLKDLLGGFQNEESLS